MDRATFSVTVAYNADQDRLLEQLRALRGQVDAAIVVDNASIPPLDELTTRVADLKLVIIRLPENRGIAGGLNAGIAAAGERGARRFFLLDHDSVPPAGMVGALAAVLDGGQSKDIGAVGPIIYDVRNHRPYPFIRLGWLRNHHLFCSPGVASVSCDFLISSGSLVDGEVLDAIGPYDERLFIDSVDFEWSCRARAAGYLLLGVGSATLDHRLGDTRHRVLGREMVVHSPLRIYYMTRNRIALYRRGYIPLRWKLKDVLRMLAKNTATVLFIAPRAHYLRMIVAGFSDALRGRSGPFRSDLPL